MGGVPQSIWGLGAVTGPSMLTIDQSGLSQRNAFGAVAGEKKLGLNEGLAHTGTSGRTEIGGIRHVDHPLNAEFVSEGAEVVAPKHVLHWALHFAAFREGGE